MTDNEFIHYILIYMEGADFKKKRAGFRRWIEDILKSLRTFKK